jgi:hypothetical protein
MRIGITALFKGSGKWHHRIRHSVPQYFKYSERPYYLLEHVRNQYPQEPKCIEQRKPVIFTHLDDELLALATL